MIKAKNLSSRKELKIPNSKFYLNKNKKLFHSSKISQQPLNSRVFNSQKPKIITRINNKFFSPNEKKAITIPSSSKFKFQNSISSKSKFSNLLNDSKRLQTSRIIVPEKKSFISSSFSTDKKARGDAEFFIPSDNSLKGKKRGAPPMLDSKKILYDEDGKPRVPLTLQFPGTPSSTVFYENPKSAKPSVFGKSKIEISKLKSGVTLATDTTPSPTISMAFFIKCGSIYENDDNHGICHLLERLAFKGTHNRKASELVQALEHTGGNITASSSRELMFYTAEVIGEHVENTLEVLCDVITHPEFNINDIKDEREYINLETQESLENMGGLIPEYIHHVAYGDSPLGRRLLANPEVLERLGPQELKEFHQKFYRPERIVVSIVGMEHEQAKSLVEKYLNFPRHILESSVPDIPYPESTYIGGEERIRYDDSVAEQAKEFAYYSLAFEGYGSKDDLAAAPIFTLQSLFGGGGAFSAGGPGKGMYTRFYRNVVCSAANVENLETTHHSYLNTGLFGINVAVEHGSIVDSLSIICQELVGAALQMTDEEFHRAKNQLKSTYFGSLESQSLICDDLGRQVIERGSKKQNPEFVCETIDSLQKPELQQFLKNLLLRSRPSLIYAGDQSEVESAPDLDQIMNYFKENFQ